MELPNSGLEIKTDEDTLNAVRFLVNSTAWSDFFLPTLIRARDAATQSLVWPSWERKSALPDDFLRGRIKTLDELINLGPATLAENEANLRREQAVAEESEAYMTRADLGHIGPLS